MDGKTPVSVLKEIAMVGKQLQCACATWSIRSSVKSWWGN